MTSPINRQFDEVQLRDHFVVLVEEINMDGVFGSNTDNTLSFFSWQYIIAIHEEIVLNPSNPDHVKLLQESTFVDVNSLTQMAKNIKKSQ